MEIFGVKMEILQLLVDFFQTYGYAAVFGVLILCGFGLPVPEDITLVSGGVISYIGQRNVHLMFLVGMAGVLIGDGIVFMAGYLKGEQILELKWVKKLMTPERYEKVQDQFQKYGKWVVFMARFMPGLRMPIYLSAGISKRVSPMLFLITDFFAAVISVPVWVYLGYYGADNFDLLMSWVKQGQTVFLVLVGIVIIGFIIYIKRKKATEK